MKAFVLIALQGTEENKVFEELKEYDEVKKVYVLFGEWDVLVEMEVESAEELGTFMIKNIRSRPDVKLTSSLIVAQE